MFGESVKSLLHPDSELFFFFLFQEAQIRLEERWRLGSLVRILP